jgi:nucleoside-diphosphate-sugar epimerase
MRQSLSKGDIYTAAGSGNSTDDKYILKPIPSGHGRVTKLAITLSLLTVASLIVRESMNFQEVLRNGGVENQQVVGLKSHAMKEGQPEYFRLFDTDGMNDYIENGEESLRETAERVKDACEYTHEQYEKEPKPVAKTKALVTGGAGFIGSRLVKELLRVGYDVVVLDNMSTGKESFLSKKAALVRGDCRDYDTVYKTIEEHEPVVVFHLAAQSKVLPSLKKGVDFVQFSIEQNVLATENVLKAIVQTRPVSDSHNGAINSKKKQHLGMKSFKGVQKFIYAGSSTFYGNSLRNLPFQENSKYNVLQQKTASTSPYATTKAMGETIVKLYSESYHVPTIILRLFMVFGPNEPSEGLDGVVTGKFLKQFKANEDLKIEGSGNHFRDFVHVDDVARAFVLAAQSSTEQNGRVFNVGSGKLKTINEIAELIQPDEKKRIHVAERKNDLIGTLASTCEAKEHLGFVAKLGIEDWVISQKV